MLGSRFQADATSACVPLDQHLKGFAALGATWSLDQGMVDVKVDKLVGSQIYLDVVSVGATINIMLAAVKPRGLR